MSTGEQSNPAFDQAAPLAPMQPRRWSSPEIWTLGVFSVIGILGFLATFVLIVARSSDPQNAMSRPVMGPPQQVQGERGPPGPPGPPGPVGPRGTQGEAGVRVIRPDCPTGTCNLECNEDEILLIAHCGAGRLPTIYQNERVALCRSSVRAKADVVAACVKAGKP
jgi:hypothetical protein